MTLLVMAAATQTRACIISEVDCSSITATAGLASLSCIISVCSFGLYYLWQTDKIKDLSLARFGAGLAALLLIFNSINAVVTASGSHNAVGATEGSIYLLCWASFWLSLYLCLRYLDVFALQAKLNQDEQDAATAPYSRSSSRSSAGSVDMDLPESPAPNRDTPDMIQDLAQVDVERTHRTPNMIEDLAQVDLERTQGSKRIERKASLELSLTDFAESLGMLENNEVPKLKTRHSEGSGHKRGTGRDHRSRVGSRRDIV